jgi:type I restriction enzyme S subunit
LGELGHYWNGRGFKKREWRETGRPIIRIQNLTGSGSAFNYFQGDVDERHVAHAGDLLVSWAATLGVFEWKGPEAVVNQHIFKVDSFIDRRFHRYLLEFVLEDLQKKTHGSGMVHITRKRFDETPVQVPESLDEQQRIVETIEEQFSRLDAGVESLHRASRNLNRMRASVLKAATDGDLVGSTRGPWETVTIREVAVRVDYGSSAKAYADIEGVPMLRMGNIRDGKIVLDDLKFLPSDHPDAAKFSLSPGDVLFNRTNSAELVGKSAVATGQHEGMSFASYLIRLRLGPVVVPEFVAHVINGPLGREYVARVRSQQVGQANVNGTKLAAFPLPVPPIEQQREIVAEVDRQFSLIDGAEAAIRRGVTRAGTLRQSVLQGAFSGGLSPWSSGPVRGAT